MIGRERGWHHLFCPRKYRAGHCSDWSSARIPARAPQLMASAHRPTAFSDAFALRRPMVRSHPLLITWQLRRVSLKHRRSRSRMSLKTSAPLPAFATKHGRYLCKTDKRAIDTLSFVSASSELVMIVMVCWSSTRIPARASPLMTSAHPLTRFANMQTYPHSDVQW